MIRKCNIRTSAACSRSFRFFNLDVYAGKAGTISRYPVINLTVLYNSYLNFELDIRNISEMVSRIFDGVSDNLIQDIISNSKTFLIFEMRKNFTQ